MSAIDNTLRLDTDDLVKPKRAIPSKNTIQDILEEFDKEDQIHRSKTITNPSQLQTNGSQNRLQGQHYDPRYQYLVGDSQNRIKTLPDHLVQQIGAFQGGFIPGNQPGNGIRVLEDLSQKQWPVRQTRPKSFSQNNYGFDQHKRQLNHQQQNPNYEKAYYQDGGAYQSQKDHQSRHQLEQLSYRSHEITRKEEDGPKGQSLFRFKTTPSEENKQSKPQQIRVINSLSELQPMTLEEFSQKVKNPKYDREFLSKETKLKLERKSNRATLKLKLPEMTGTNQKSSPTVSGSQSTRVMGRQAHYNFDIQEKGRTESRTDSPRLHNGPKNDVILNRIFKKKEKRFEFSEQITENDQSKESGIFADIKTKKRNVPKSSVFKMAAERTLTGDGTSKDTEYSSSQVY